MKADLEINAEKNRYVPMFRHHNARQDHRKRGEGKIFKDDRNISKYIHE